MAAGGIGRHSIAVKPRARAGAKGDGHQLSPPRSSGGLYALVPFFLPDRVTAWMEHKNARGQIVSKLGAEPIAHRASVFVQADERWRRLTGACWSRSWGVARQCSVREPLSYTLPDLVVRHRCLLSTPRSTGSRSRPSIKLREADLDHDARLDPDHATY